MLWRVKTKKSAGVRVTASVHRHIAKGNAARDARQWTAAASSYSAAVAEDPLLYHIWVQLGHARKESGQYKQSERAYARAIALRDGASEPLLHLGHLHKVAGDMFAAGRAFYEAVKAEPGNADAVAELHRVLATSARMPRERIIALLRQSIDTTLPSDTAAEQAVKTAQQSLELAVAQLGGADRQDLDVLRSATEILGTIEQKMAYVGHDDAKVALVFDASDLIGYYTHARLPTGIQRVQIEAISSALAAADRNVRICCFIDGRDDWLEIPPATFRHITSLSVRNGERNDPDWTAALNQLHIMLALADPFDFPDGAFLVNLGTSWWLHNYFLFVRHAKAKHNIRYIPFVHDFIPIITPEHCVKGLTQDFISWAIGVFDHADYFLVNSEATKRDLIKVGSILGHDVDPANVSVIRLDADFRKPETRKLGREMLGKWGLESEPFVLFVSTIESRKGHVVAMDAWLELIRRRGGRRVPRLVCVGKNGWLNDTVYQRLEQSDELAKRVTMLSYLSDDELALLYGSCLFTIYPSLYEGWGLPITEALCYGKPVIAADSSSLPEAGGDFAVYVSAHAPNELADAVEKMTDDAAYRAAVVRKIETEFKPRDWREISREMDGEIMRLTSRDAASGSRFGAPRPMLGNYHPVTRNIETRIWPGMGSGEIFRTGLGWLWPDIWGCWTRPQGGGLTIGLAPDQPPVRVYLLLHGVPNHECQWRLRIKGRRDLSGTLAAGERKWVSFDYAVSGESTLRMHLRGDWVETITMSTGGSDKQYSASVGLAGFFICALDDIDSRTAFLEAAALGNVRDLDAYRDRADQDELVNELSSWDE